MEDRILESTKERLNIESNHRTFDFQISSSIDSALGILGQAGAGIASSVSLVEDDTTTWSSLGLTNEMLRLVRTHVFLYALLLWDPPQTSFGLKAREAQLDELIWRVRSQAEMESMA